MAIALVGGVAMLLVAHVGSARRIARWMTEDHRAEAADVVPAGAAQVPVAASAPEARLGVAPPVSPSRVEAGRSPSVANARDLMGVYGIDGNEFKKFWDGRPLGDDETEILLRILSRLKDCRAADIERWAREPVEVAKLAAAPAVSRGAMFALSGRVVSLDPVQVPPAVAERAGVRQLYRVVLLLDPEKRRAVVYTDRTAGAWSRGHAIGERVALSGMFLKLSASDLSEPLPVLVSPRLAWHPTTLLGNLGMDVALLDDVTDDKSLEDCDREAFYEMLAAAGRAQPGQLLRIAGEELNQSGQRKFSVAALFNEPAKQRGRLVSLSGVARRTVRIPIEDLDIVARFHRDHYYEIDLFPDDSQGNPVVVCVPDLPEGMSPGGPPQYREPIEVAGFFLKTWRYPAVLCDEDRGLQSGKAVVQSAPLLIGQTPVRCPQARSGPTATGMIAGAMLALVMIGVWLLLWHLRHGDREFHEKVLARRDLAFADDSDG